MCYAKVILFLSEKSSRGLPVWLRVRWESIFWDKLSYWAGDAMKVFSILVAVPTFIAFYTAGGIFVRITESLEDPERYVVGHESEIFISSSTLLSNNIIEFRSRRAKP